MYVVPKPVVAELINAAGEFRNTLTSAMRVAEHLDNMIAGVDPTARALLQAEINSAVPGLSEHVVQPHIDHASAPQQLQDVKFAHGDGPDDFLFFVNSLSRHLYELNKGAIEVQP